MDIRFKLEVLSNLSRLTAWQGITRLGKIEWNTDKTYDSTDIGRIEDIYVHHEYRRQGVATALLKRAKEEDIRVHHASTRTPLGQLWAMSTGDRLPKWQPIPAYSDNPYAGV